MCPCRFERLALWALAKDYGRDIVYSGPAYKRMKIEGDTIRLFFDHVDSGLDSKGKPLTHFTIAAAYGWNDTAITNLSNKEGLPASPFRTDSFPLVTAGRK